MKAGGLRITLACSNDRAGGAAMAASRLRDGLLAAGEQVRLLVQTQDVPHPATVGPQRPWQRLVSRVRSDLDSLPVRRAGGVPARFSASWLPRRWPRVAEAWPAGVAADVVHLHWTNAGFLSVADIGALASAGAPLVWTLHDMWALTGGCQYDEGCGRFAQGCGHCPQLGRRGSGDLSERRFGAKRASWNGRAITLVTPSRWLADEARRSPVWAGHRIEVLRNGLDLERYKPLPRDFARQALGLPADRKLVLFGALNAGSDGRKGLDLLRSAIGHLSRDESAAAGLMLVVAGSNPPRDEQTEGLPTRHFGHLHDDIALALLYAACDVFVCPSRQENLPNTVAESLACGTPVVAFRIGGLPDLVEHGRNGWLAPALDAEGLAEGIRWCLADTARHRALGEAARAFALEHLALERQTARHLRLYQELLAEQARPRRAATALPAPDSRAPT